MSCSSSEMAISALLLTRAGSQLPYGTLTDDEMMRMPVGSMQDEGGLLFLWVTGRAMELGRDCLTAWG